MRIRSLYLNIYLTVVTVLLLFALVAALVVRHRAESERERIDTAIAARGQGWGTVIEKTLPPASADPASLLGALQEASAALSIELAVDDAQGVRLAATPGFEAERQRHAGSMAHLQLGDGRVLWMGRPRPPWVHGRDHERDPAHDERRGGPPPRPPEPRDGPLSGPDRPPRDGAAPFGWRWFDEGLMLLGLLFAAIAAGSYPVVRRITRRLETLRNGVEAFGAGALDYRVPVQGSDEVSAVATSFNRAAQRIEDLVRAHRSLLANASHELRSPLARLKMAVSMLESADADRRDLMRQEIDRDIRELDLLVEEVLLASRLDAQAPMAHDPVDLPALVAEEAARVQAEVDVAPGAVAARLRGDERLLRRAVRNLLENARRYGGAEVGAEISVQDGSMVVRVCDRGPGVPEAERERIFEPFYRLPGHSEMAGGVGLGLSLVRQIALRHRGSVRWQPRDGGGSCFILSVPLT